MEEMTAHPLWWCSSRQLKVLARELAAKGGCQIWVVSTGTQDLSNALLLSAYVQVYLNEKLKIEHCPRVSLPMNLNKYKQGT